MKAGTPRSLRLAAALTVGAVVAVSCLRDIEGPAAGRSARLALLPVFASAAAGVVEFDHVRVTVVRGATVDRAERPVVDTLVPFPATADSVELAIRVPLEAMSEQFLVFIRLITAAGDTVFRNSPYPQSVIARAGAVSAVLEAILTYVGVGFDAVAVVITTPNAVIAPGATLDLAAVALAADQSPIPGTPIAWSSLDPTRVAVPDPAVGHVVGVTELGPARIVARLPTGPADTVIVTNELGPPPAVVFAGDSAGGQSSGVFHVDRDGRNRVRLTDLGSGGDVHPRRSPDLRRVVFTYGSKAGAVNQLYVVARSADTITSLLADTSARRPRWSPDGVRLAFECGDGFSPGQDVCVIPDVTGPLTALSRIGEGAGRVVVTDFDKAKLDGPGSFAWDPLDGKSLFVVRDSTLQSGDVASRVWLVTFDGLGFAPVSPEVMDFGKGPLRIVGPLDITPDGSTIVFAAVDPGFVQTLYAIRRDGANLRQVSGGPYDWAPVISPDGQRIAFLRDATGCSVDYWLANVDGSGEQQLSNEDLCDFDTSVLGHDWSPDGKELVLVGRNVGGHFLVYRVPAGTTQATYATDRVLIGRDVDAGAFVVDVQPSWRP